MHTAGGPTNTLGSAPLVLRPDPGNPYTPMQVTQSLPSSSSSFLTFSHLSSFAVIPFPALSLSLIHFSFSPSSLPLLIYILSSLCSYPPFSITSCFLPLSVSLLLCNSPSQCVVLRPAAPASPSNWLAMHILRPHPGPAACEGQGSASCGKPDP